MTSVSSVLKGFLVFSVLPMPVISSDFAHIGVGSASNISYATSNQIEVKGNSGSRPTCLSVRPAIMRGLPAPGARIWIRE